ncbi:unnamed protein product [marine sediment metagenome]|uniref:Uncharacterized protein n=1 Tax=marine sediment metagenome TaxID=412755 RepID=X1BL03_9ZZZZ
MGWIDSIVVGIIIVGGLFIFYKALKEPIDLLLSALGKVFAGIKDRISDMGGGGSGYEEIVYG